MRVGRSALPTVTWATPPGSKRTPLKIHHFTPPQHAACHPGRQLGCPGFVPCVVKATARAPSAPAASCRPQDSCRRLAAVGPPSGSALWTRGSSGVGRGKEAPRGKVAFFPCLGCRARLPLHPSQPATTWPPPPAGAREGLESGPRTQSGAETWEARPQRPVRARPTGAAPGAQARPWAHTVTLAAPRPSGGQLSRAGKG